jgi:hypothetical protein
MIRIVKVIYGEFSISAAAAAAAADDAAPDVSK